MHKKFLIWCEFSLFEMEVCGGEKEEMEISESESNLKLIRMITCFFKKSFVPVEKDPEKLVKTFQNCLAS